MSSAATPEFSEAPQPPAKKKIGLKTTRAREKEKEAAQKKEQRPKTPPPVDERVAHIAMRHFIAAQLHQSGFSSASTSLLDEIERCTVQCALVMSIECYSLRLPLPCTDASLVFMQVYGVALKYANVSFRTDANAYDVVASCEEAGIDVYALRKVARRKRKSNSSSKSTIIHFVQHVFIIIRHLRFLNFELLAVAKAPLPLLPPRAPPGLLVFLPSDSSGDETNNKYEPNKSKKSKAGKAATGAETPLAGATAGANQRKSNKKDAAIPKSLKDIPKHLPNPPPKHTYLRTAVSIWYQTIR